MPRPLRATVIYSATQYRLLRLLLRFFGPRQKGVEEREGFEPSVQALGPYNGLANRRLRPTRPPLPELSVNHERLRRRRRDSNPRRFRATVFKTVAFDHSATPPLDGHSERVPTPSSRKRGVLITGKRNRDKRAAREAPWMASADGSSASLPGCCDSVAWVRPATVRPLRRCQKDPAKLRRSRRR